MGRLIHLSSSDATVCYSYSYDLNNNPIKVVDEVSSLTSIYSYDAWNRTISDGLEGACSQSYTYDALGRLTSLIAPDSSEVIYAYQASHLHSISWKGFEHSYTGYDLKSRPQQCALIGKAGVHNLVWDKKGRITKVASSHYNHQISEDGFDAVGNLKKCSFTDALGKVDVTASYDDLYQLTEETGVQNHVYTNDSISNRRSKNGSSYTLDNTNKLLCDSENTFVYDKNGNLLEHATPIKTTKFTYDALDRLIQVSDGTQEVRYYYDNFHRRIARSINNSPLEYFLYLGQREVGLWSSHQLKEYRVLGLGKGAELGASVALELDGVTYCPLHDHRGNIIALVDAQTGHIAESYRYTAFGECETYNHKQQQIEKTAVGNPWGYASKRLDPETGFVYFSRRYYAPTTGRWITPDPLGFADGPNMYAYVHGNPMTHFDLFGLLDEEDDEIGRHSIYCLGGMLYQTGVIAYNMVHYSAEFIRDPIRQMQNIGLGVNDLIGKGCNYVAEFEFEHVREFMASCPQRMVSNDGLSSEQHSFDNGRAIANGAIIVGGILRTPKLGSNNKSSLVFSNVNEGKGTYKSRPLANIGRAKNNIKPHPDAEGAHSVFKRDMHTGNITHYATFEQTVDIRNPNPWNCLKRFDGVGEKEGHYNKVLGRNVLHPHVHKKSAPGGVIEADKTEIPKKIRD